MAGRCLPEQPAFKSRAEERVWQALRAKLRDGDVLLANVRFTGEHDGDWEADLILLLPDAGFATIEVKGGHVWREAGQWHQRTPQGVKTLDLADQAVSEKYLVRRYLMHHRQWRFGAPRMAHFVALPDEEMAPDADPGPDLPRSRIIARDDVNDASGRVWDVLRSALHHARKAPPGPDAVALAADVLAGRGDPQRELAGLLAVRGEHVARLTEAQYSVLSLAQALPRYQVVGGPGTGKTWLAAEQARRWASDGARVGFVAYSRGLTTWVRRTVDAWPAKVRARVDVTTFHGLGYSWGAVPDEAADQHHWDEEIPRQMALLAAGLPDAARFDALIVDEAQDFGAAWWPALLGGLRDPAGGRLAVFGDAAQQVFGRDGSGDLGLPVLTLAENLRNSGPIGNAVNALLPGAMRLLGGAGPDVVFVPCPTGEAVGVADDEAVRLLDAGWPHGDVVLLTTQHRHPLQIEAVEAHGRDGYWELFWGDGEIFYSTVAGFKGLERPAVVLAVDGFRDPATARETLLVGLSRARDQLVVCGDPAHIRDVAGPEGARRLGIR